MYGEFVKKLFEHFYLIHVSFYMILRQKKLFNLQINDFRTKTIEVVNLTDNLFNDSNRPNLSDYTHPNLNNLT